jgi:triosephosphate isomerase/fructose/tagatose bisphosphate aldolase
MSKIMNRLMVFAILITFVGQSTDIGYLPLSIKDNHGTLKTMMTAVPGNRVTAELSAEMLLKTQVQVKTASAGLDIADGLPIQIGAQDITLLRGAKTGRLSLDTAIVNTLDTLSFVIVGHSEMRALGLTDAGINETIKGICAYNKEHNKRIKIVLCVGETEQEKNTIGSKAVVKFQLDAALNGVSAEDLHLGKLEIAYEPRWAIGGSGTGEKATPKYANNMSALIDAKIASMYSTLPIVPILFGGSVDETNAADYIAQDYIRGFLVGGASTRPEKLLPIIKDVEKAARATSIRFGFAPNLFVRCNLKTYKTEAILKLITGIKENIDSNKVGVGFAPEASNLLPFTLALRRAMLGDDAKLNESDIITSIITKSSSAGTVPALLNNIKEIITVYKERVIIHDINRLREETVDYLANEAALNENLDVRKAASRILAEVGELLGINSSSIHNIYMARRRGEILHKVTVPANNLRGMAFDAAQAGFKVIMENNGIAIFEIARSETGYTKQPPYEYAAMIYAAAIKTGYKGPIFLQLDHAQTKKDLYFGIGQEANPQKAMGDIRDLVKESIEARFFNIDVDPSTLMVAGNLKSAALPELTELGLNDLKELGEKALMDMPEKDILLRQTFNIRETVGMVEYIRGLEERYNLPLTIAIGAEDMHVDQDVLSTPHSVKVFAQAMEKALAEKGIKEGEGIVKISVQSGSKHGGVTIAGVPVGAAGVPIDFKILEKITQMAERGELGSTISGSVQHGASTLPEKYFGEFSYYDVMEVHLATGFQNEQIRVIREENPALYQKLNESMVASSFWSKDGKDEEIKKAIRKYLGVYYESAFGKGNKIPATTLANSFKVAVNLVETQEDWAGFTNGVIDEVKALEGSKVNKDINQIVRFAIAEAFYRSYKKVFGLEKIRLWGIDSELKGKLEQALKNNFGNIWKRLNFVNTIEQIRNLAPIVPINLTLRPEGLQEAVKASSAGIQEPRGHLYPVGHEPSFLKSINYPISVPNQDFKRAINGLSSEELDADWLKDIATWLKGIMPAYKEIIEEKGGDEKPAKFNLQYAEDTVKTIEGILNYGIRLQEYEGMRKEFTGKTILKEHIKLIPWFLDRDTTLGKQIAIAQGIGELKEIEKKIGCRPILFTPGDDVPALLLQNGFSVDTQAIGISTPKNREYFKTMNIRLIALDNLANGQYLSLSLLAMYSKVMLYVSTIDDPKIHGKLMNLAIQLHNSINLQRQEVATLRAA